MPLERAPNREVRAPNVRKREPPRLKLQSGGVGTGRCVRTRKIKFSTFGGKGEEEGTRSKQMWGLEWLP